MRIIIVSDIPNWAIGHLAQSVAKYNDHHNIKLMYVHPRDAGSAEVQQNFLREVRAFNPHLIDFEYFRTAGQLLEALPELYRYKLVLMHHNMRDKALYMWDWQNNLEIDKPHLKIDKVLAHCNQTKELLESKGYAKKVEVIRYGFDHNFWTFSEEESNERAIGYCGRIVPWKGLREIAKVAKELNYLLQIMGKEDKMDYWETVPKESLRFDFLDCPDDERVNFFRNITIFVQNAIEGYEEGPMPMMEAMACGVPVITTPVGQAGYMEGIFKDRINCLMVPVNDEFALKNAIKELMEDKELRNSLRKEGWETVKNMTEEKMARSYSKIWNKIVYPDNQLVSIIVPGIYSRIKEINIIMKALTLQTYSNIEVVLVWDEEERDTKDLGFDRKEYDISIKEHWVGLNKEKHPYNLGAARNIGILEAEGEVLVFNDSRLEPDENAVMMFAEAVKNASMVIKGGNKKVWFFGDKGSQKQSFVENWSAVNREFLINIGMFSERIDRYGGMTQEIRTRWKLNKGEFSYLGIAVCSEITGSRKNSKKRRDIVKSKLKINKLYGDLRF